MRDMCTRWKREEQPSTGRCIEKENDGDAEAFTAESVTGARSNQFVCVSRALLSAITYPCASIEMLHTRLQHCKVRQYDCPSFFHFRFLCLSEEHESVQDAPAQKQALAGA